MESKEVVANEVARQAEFGYEPSWLDFVIAGQRAGRQEVVEEIEKHNLYEKKNGRSYYQDDGISRENCESLDDREWWLADLEKWGIK